MVEIVRNINDLWNSLQAILLELRSHRALRKHEMIGPFTVTVGTSRLNLFGEGGVALAGENRVSQLYVRCRTIGAGGTYVAIGQKDALEFRLDATNMFYLNMRAQPGYYWNASELHVKGDAAGNVLEVWAMTA